jgi:hypothetical protein
MPQALGVLSFEARLTPRTLRHEDAKDRLAAQDEIASQLRTRTAVVEGRACLRMSTPKARAALNPAPHIEIDVLERNKRPLCRSCVDWSERKHHLGGAVGAAVLGHALVKRWAGRGPHSRAVTFSALGEKKFVEWFSL